MALQNVIQCPACQSAAFLPFLQCEDFTTTGEKFDLQKCSVCGFVVTSPRPDPNSLGRYYESGKYISHTGDSSSLFDSIYLLARRFTLKRKIKLVSYYAASGKLLDYGCGTGEFLNTAAENQYQSFGIEPSGIAHAKAQLGTSVTVFKSLDQLPEQQFDAITLWHVLEHVADLETTLAALQQKLSENGTLFVAVPNHTSWDAGFYKEFWAAYDVPRHLWHFSKETMKLITLRANLKILSIRPMKLDAYYVSLLSEKNKTGRQTLSGIIRAVWTAFISNLKGRTSLNYSSLIYVLKK